MSTEQTPEAIGTLDHEQHNEYIVFGPPGCGKSTNLQRQIARAAERFGATSVLCTSFSKAAAAELAGRDLPIPRHAIGTLHAHCYRALGAPEIAEEHVDEWNRDNPELQITKQSKSEEGEHATDGGSGEDTGNGWLSNLSRVRSQMIPPEGWSRNLREFAARWQDYKDANDLMDFTDLIETAYRDVRVAPGQPSVIFADEAQDFTALEFSLVRRWGRNAEYFVSAGDDDQCIYGFTGASPLPLIENDVPEAHKIVLKQSYRVPRNVQALAEQTIAQVTKRQPKVYNPRDEDGEVLGISGNLKTPQRVLDDVERRVAAGSSVMLLASCNYMLQALVTMLRERGLPFHNPYRKSNGSWNPLRRDEGSAGSRLLALLGPHPGLHGPRDSWTFNELRLWSDWIASAGVLKRGAKRIITNSQVERAVTMQDLAALFEDAALDQLLACFEGDVRELLNWWARKVKSPAHKRSADFASEIVRKRGIDGLVQPPKVCVGTIHSVKGGEADYVYLFPDLSRAGWAQFETPGEQRDSIIRLFYVAMTRAKKGLLWCDPMFAQASFRLFDARSFRRCA